MGKELYQLRTTTFQYEGHTDLNIYQCGYEKCAPDHHWGPAMRTHFLFHYIISGKGVFKNVEPDGTVKSFEVKERQAFLIFPGQTGSYQADEVEPWEYIWLEFDGMCVTVPVTTAGLSREKPVLLLETEEDAHEIFNNIQNILNYHEESDVYLTALGYLFLESLAKAGVPKEKKVEKNSKKYYMEQALTFIRQNYAKDISVEDIAGECGINRSYFGKLFRESMGQTPQNFLMNFRINKACELLTTTKKTIREIAEEVGYPDSLHFSKVFKSIMRASPQEWRNGHTTK